MQILASLLTWIAATAFVLALVLLWVRVPNRTRAASLLLTVAILAALARLWPWITQHLGPYDNDWATAGVALVAFTLALWQYRGSIEQTARDFRWKQAEKAKELGDELLMGKSIEALNLIDYPKRQYNVSSKSNKDAISRNQVVEVLKLSPDELALPPGELKQILETETSVEQAMFIRDCFDDLLNKLDRIYALKKMEYILWPDVAVVLRYYLDLLRNKQPTLVDVICKYCMENGNDEAKKVITNHNNEFPISSKTDSRSSRSGAYPGRATPIGSSEALM